MDHSVKWEDYELSIRHNQFSKIDEISISKSGKGQDEGYMVHVASFPVKVLQDLLSTLKPHNDHVDALSSAYKLQGILGHHETGKDKTQTLNVVISVTPEMTDKGIDGKMTPRPAVDYWKELAIKYREHARGAGQAANIERDQNAALRGKLLRIGHILDEKL